jgi:hypothetical protein
MKAWIVEYSFNNKNKNITAIHNKNSWGVLKTRMANEQRESSKTTFNRIPLNSSPLYTWPKPMEIRLKKADTTGFLFFVMECLFVIETSIQCLSY